MWVWWAVTANFTIIPFAFLLSQPRLSTKPEQDEREQRKPLGVGGGGGWDLIKDCLCYVICWKRRGSRYHADEEQLAWGFLIACSDSFQVPSFGAHSRKDTDVCCWAPWTTLPSPATAGMYNTSSSPRLRKSGCLEEHGERVGFILDKEFSFRRNCFSQKVYNKWWAQVFSVAALRFIE